MNFIFKLFTIIDYGVMVIFSSSVSVFLICINAGFFIWTCYNDRFIAVKYVFRRIVINRYLLGGFGLIYLSFLIPFAIFLQAIVVLQMENEKFLWSILSIFTCSSCSKNLDALLHLYYDRLLMKSVACIFWEK